MDNRPPLSKQLDERTFRSFYYLKEELMDFCRKNGLSAAGGKLELTDRIAHYLTTGGRLAAKPVQRPKTAPDRITEEAKIEANFVCSEKHRAFFKEKLGKTFSFNVAFQEWLKSNPGKTYAQALTAYRQLLEEKKQKKTKIGRQFEYNTYIRDFFADNPGKTLSQAILCWKFKKEMPGHNRYEKEDIQALAQKGKL